MALQIWLPLNKSGDLSNKGLANITVTNNGATYNASGKIGGCYTGFNTGFMTLNKEAMSTLSGEFTISCWIKINSYNSNYQTVWSGCSTSSSWNNMIMVLLRNGGGSNLIFCISNNSSATQSACSAGTIELGNWMHITCCYKPGHIITYKNGILVLDYSTSIIPNVSTIKSCLIGRDYGAYPNDMNINDFRIYDHCLSPKEVKEISKGLVLHYSLNLEVTKNLVPFNLSADNYTFSDYSNRTLSSIVDGIYHVDGYQLNSSIDTSFTAYSKLYITLNADTDYYLSFYCKSKSASELYFGTSGLAYTGLISNSNVRAYPVTSVSLGTNYIGWVSLKIHTGTDTLYKICLGFDGPNIYGIDSFIEFSNVMLSVAKPNDFVPYESNDIVYDSSGYNNNGTITGTLTTSTDTSRYDKCTLFDGVNSVIKGSLSLANDYKYTASFWYKPTTISSGTLWVFAIASGNSSNHLFGCYINNTTIVTNVGGVIGASGGASVFNQSLVANTLYHIVITCDGTNTKVYVDGDLLGTAAKNGTTTGNIFWIGLRPGAPGNYNLSGKLSDFRIYATALSADDIKDLYQEAAFIDHKGNVGCYLFYEDADSQITKTGQIRTEEFEEISDLSDGVAKVYELKIECNQLIEI